MKSRQLNSCLTPRDGKTPERIDFGHDENASKQRTS